MSGLIEYDEFQYDSLLTNQKLTSRFKSRFDLVLYALGLARNAVKSGSGKVVVGNLSYEVLRELYNKDVDFSDKYLSFNNPRKVLSKFDHHSSTVSKRKHTVSSDFANDIE